MYVFRDAQRYLRMPLSEVVMDSHARSGQHSRRCDKFAREIAPAVQFSANGWVKQPVRAGL
jgi:hypothetical protein